MENETQKIIEEQIGKLPKEIISFLSSANWSNSINEIGSLYNLSETEFFGFKREAALVLAGIVHPDEFKEVLEKEVGLKGAVLEAVVTATEQKIFASIRPALIHFFEEESAKAEIATPAKEIPVVDAAPANIPTEIKEEPLIPPLTPKVTTPQTIEPGIPPVHPFEEKMQSTPVSTATPTPSAMPATFTPASASTAPAPIAPVVPTAPQDAVAFTPTSNGVAGGTLTHDPYREPIE